MHIRNTHQLQDNICDICGKSFAKTKSLESHMNSVHSTQTCDICGKAFKPPAFRKHRKICQPSYSCQDCDFQTSIKHEFDHHRRNHTAKGKQKFKCLLCNYVAGHKHHLKTHMLHKHTEKHKCDEDGCDKEFVRAESLEDHKQSHYGKIKCDYCDKQFVRKSALEKHVLKEHCRDTLETSSGFMILHRTAKVIKKKTYYHCTQCNYKSDRKRNLTMHINNKHIAPKSAFVKNKTCHKCKFTFTRYSNFQKHQQRCKYELAEKIDPQDYVKLMRERNFNFSDIAAVNRFNRIRFGRKAAAPNLTRTLSKAVEEMQEFFITETLTFTKKKKGDKVAKKFQSSVAMTSDVNKFALMACEEEGIDPDTAEFLVQCDGGQDHIAISLHITTPETDAVASDGYKQTGTKHSLLLLLARGVPENYHNLSLLLKKLNLRKFKFSYKFVGDYKLLAIILGLSPSNSIHMCPYCDGCRFDENGNPTNKKGVFRKGKHRDMGWLFYNNARIKIERMRGKKVEAKAHRNCINEPIIIRGARGLLGHSKCPILFAYPPDPLHTVLLGSPNDLFKILDVLCKKAMEDFKAKHHLSMSEGILYF